MQVQHAYYEWYTFPWPAALTVSIRCGYSPPVCHGCRHAALLPFYTKRINVYSSPGVLLPWRHIRKFIYRRGKSLLSGHYSICGEFSHSPPTAMTVYIYVDTIGDCPLRPPQDGTYERFTPFAKFILYRQRVWKRIIENHGLMGRSLLPFRAVSFSFLQVYINTAFLYCQL